MADLSWGVDLGGTKIEGAVLRSTREPDALCRIRVPTEAERGYAHILDRVSDLVDQLARECGARPRRIGFGTPGVLDARASALKNSSTACYNGMPLRRDLEARLGVGVELANDANC